MYTTEVLSTIYKKTPAAPTFPLFFVLSPQYCGRHINFRCSKKPSFNTCCITHLIHRTQLSLTGNKNKNSRICKPIYQNTKTVWVMMIYSSFYRLHQHCYVMNLMYVFNFQNSSRWRTREKCQESLFCVTTKRVY